MQLEAFGTWKIVVSIAVGAFGTWKIVLYIADGTFGTWKIYSSRLETEKKKRIEAQVSKGKIETIRLYHKKSAWILEDSWLTKKFYCE